MYREALQRRLGLTYTLIRGTTLTDLVKAVDQNPADLAIITISWAERAEDVENCFQELYRRSPRPRLVFLDYYAPTCSPHFGVLPYVDLYLKRQVLRDRSLYQEDFLGGYIFADYLARQHGYELDDWFFGSKPDPTLSDKILAGWNLGVTPKYRRICKISRAIPLPWAMRPFDVNLRLGLPTVTKEEWYQRYRRTCLKVMEPLRADFRCTGARRIVPKLFLAEMMLSKVVVSPFGWGELCFRDYEAVASGVLLIKPSMDHLQTSPNIFIPGETYVATGWDPHEMGEACRYYLAHPEEARRIAFNGREALLEYFEGGGFVGEIRRVLERVGLGSEVVRPTDRCLNSVLK